MGWVPLAVRPPMANFRVIEPVDPTVEPAEPERALFRFSVRRPVIAGGAWAFGAEGER